MLPNDTQSDHRLQMNKLIREFYCSEFATDLTLNSSDNFGVECHLAVLCAVSGYHRALFNSNVPHAGVNMIEVDSPKDVIKALLDFIYIGKISSVSLRSNVAELLSLSCKWEIIPALMQCINFIKANLQVSNCIEFYELAERIRCGKLDEIIANYTKQNFKALLADMQLGKLSPDSMHKLVHSLSVHDVSEEDKINGILQWLTANPDYQHRIMLTSAINYKALTIAQLHTIKKNPAIGDAELAVIGEELAYKYEEASTMREAEHQSYIRRQEEQLEKQRQDLRRERQMMERQQKEIERQHTVKLMAERAEIEREKERLLKGPLNKDAAQDIQTESLIMRSRRNMICKYDASLKKWQDLLKVPNWCDEYTSWYPTGYKVVVASARNVADSRRVGILDLRLEFNLELPEMPLPRQWPGVAVFRNKLCIIGGCNTMHLCQKTMFMYDDISLTNCKWSKCAELIQEVSYPITACYNNMLYVFGGYRNMDFGGTHYLRVQIFDTVTNRWSLGKEMPHGCALDEGRCIQQGNVCTIITSTACMEYNIVTDSWKVFGTYTSVSPYDRCSAVSYKGDILVTGVHDARFVWRFDSANPRAWVKTDIDISDISGHEFLFNNVI